jgi:creatinine amidohydrolase
MRWEDLTGDDFVRAVADSQRVCLLSMGIIERHGPHLPLGTDMLNGQYICDLAALREKAVVFPPWFLGQIFEASCFPGTITIPPALTVELLLAILDEIGRNGFTKIIIYVAHGGNNHLAPFLSQCMHHSPKPYSVYVAFYDAAMTPEDHQRFNAVMDVPEGGHADEMETCLTLAHRPELVKMECIRHHPGAKPLHRLDAVTGQARTVYSPIGWYANFPEHYAGDARQSTPEKGAKLAGIMADALAGFIQRVKADKVAPALDAEFFARKAKVATAAPPTKSRKPARKAPRRNR